MIKILEYGKVENSEIFSRGADPVNVSSTVAEIIQNVKNNKDNASSISDLLTSSWSSLTPSNFSR